MQVKSELSNANNLHAIEWKRKFGFKLLDICCVTSYFMRKKACKNVQIAFQNALPIDISKVEFRAKEMF